MPLEEIGHYTLASHLGAGGMGVVHLAYSPSGRKVAVKVVHARYAADPEFRARFRQEVAAARRVSGAFTASVVDADPEAVRPWMATLYIPGPTLSAHVRRHGPLQADELLRLAAGLAEALRDIHRAGVVHRDLKPSNVLLAEDGPKVIDFGISRPSDSELKTETGKLIGTPPFMAPEQFSRPREVGPAADVFALGSVLVHAARGKGPFDSDSPYVVAYQVVHDEPDLSDVPEELAPLIRDCLAKDPADRPTPDALMALARREGWHPALPLGPVQGGAESSTMWLRSWAEAETESGDGDGDEEEDEDGAGAGGESGSGERPAPAPAPAGAAHGQRRWARWAAAGAAVAVLAGGGFAVVRHLPGGEPGRPTATAQDAVRAWEAEVPGAQGADKTAVRTAACAYDAVGPALYCVDRGVKAARMDPATGKAVWSRPGTRTATGQAPVVSGGLVLIVSSDGTGLEALAPGTGRTRWTADLAPYGGYRYITKDTVLLVAPSGMVTALDSATGKPRWAEAVPGHARPIFTAYGDTAYARTLSDDGTHTLVTAVATRTGNVRWTHSFEGDLLPVGTSGGTLYLTRNGVSGAITAVVRYDPASTAETSTELPYPVPGASATVADGVVYMLGNDGAVLAVGPHGVKWQLQTSVNSPSQPVAAERRLYFGAGNGRLTAVDLTRGAFLGQTPLRLDAGRRGYLVDLQPPIVAGNRVFAYTPNGTIFCTDPRKLTG